ncbi:hypothetical protein ABDK56_10000 [Sphingomonas sp. ASV193]|uniref:hypothetical protein n=1 Tax=Sphingomonas sp. ASV193 TaxID=3144405 RepID=UPI0032E90F90
MTHFLHPVAPKPTKDIHAGACRADRRRLLGGLASGTMSLAGALLLPRSLLARPRPAEERALVMVVASIHRRLATTKSYTFDDLYGAVARFRPDAVGVEIRQEDLDRGQPYLTSNYPPEMIALAAQYGPRTFGFDWLGDELAGAAIPTDWWSKESPIKQLERSFDDRALPNDAHHRRLEAALDRLSSEQDRLLASATVRNLVDGRYDRVTGHYYATLRALVAGTRFDALARYYERRDAMIARNVLSEATRRRGQRVAIVTGGDHHGPVVRLLAANAGTVRLMPIA